MSVVEKGRNVSRARSGVIIVVGPWICNVGA